MWESGSLDCDRRRMKSYRNAQRSSSFLCNNKLRHHQNSPHRNQKNNTALTVASSTCRHAAFAFAFAPLLIQCTSTTTHPSHWLCSIFTRQMRSSLSATDAVILVAKRLLPYIAKRLYDLSFLLSCRRYENGPSETWDSILMHSKTHEATMSIPPWQSKSVAAAFVVSKIASMFNNIAKEQTFIWQTNHWRTFLCLNFSPCCFSQNTQCFILRWLAKDDLRWTSLSRALNLNVPIISIYHIWLLLVVCADEDNIAGVDVAVVAPPNSICIHRRNIHCEHLTSDTT